MGSSEWSLTRGRQWTSVMVWYGIVKKKYLRLATSKSKLCQERLTKGIFSSMHLRNFKGTWRTPALSRLEHPCTSPFICVPIWTIVHLSMDGESWPHFMFFSLAGFNVLSLVLVVISERYCKLQAFQQNCIANDKRQTCRWKWWGRFLKNVYKAMENRLSPVLREWGHLEHLSNWKTYFYCKANACCSPLINWNLLKSFLSAFDDYSNPLYVCIYACRYEWIHAETYIHNMSVCMLIIAKRLVGYHLVIQFSIDAVL